MNLKIVQLENCLESEQYSHIVVDKQDTALHRHLRVTRSCSYKLRAGRIPALEIVVIGIKLWLWPYRNCCCGVKQVAIRPFQQPQKSPCDSPGPQRWFPGILNPPKLESLDSNVIT